MGVIQIKGHFCNRSGYGHVTESAVIGMRSLGVDVYPVAESVDLTIPWKEVIQEEFARFRKSRRFGGLLHINLPMFEDPQGGRRMFYTMWEQTGLKPEWVANLNTCTVVVVPCKGNQLVFSASGVRVPIEVVPLGVSRTVGIPLEENPKVFVFGTGGSGDRKNAGKVIRAFKKAYPKDDSVRLSVKVPSDSDLKDPADWRVVLDKRELGEEDYNAWLESMHCFVSASSGEGFGLISAKAMAKGRPFVGASFLGTADYLDETVGEVVPYVLVPGETGMVCDVSVDDLVVAMKAIRGRCGEKGKKARERMERYSQSNFARGLYSVAAGYGIIE